MNRTFTQVCAALVVMVVFVARSEAASGQPTSEVVKGLRPSGLPTVYVRDSAGVETQGKLLALSPESLTLLVDGVERRLDLSSVTRIQRRDSLKNGTITGAIVGVGMGLLTGRLADCSGQAPGHGCAGFRVAMVALSTGVYAGLGTGIDALIPGRTTIYAAPAGSRDAASSASPGSTPVAMLHARMSW